jgi:hypothetical protein
MILTKKLFAPTLTVFGFFCIATGRPQSRPADTDRQIEHGRYLVQNVGLCGDCHSPHDDHGQVIKTRELQGASLTFKPLGPVPNWSEYAPGLVGLLGFTDDQMVTFLTTGKDPSGKFARPPMPTYRLNRKDGTAMVSYLRSLTPKQK